MLQPNGFPQPRLEVKVAAPIFLLRNLDPGRGFCNGTRLVVTRLGRYGVAARIVGTEFDGEERIIPRIKLIENDDDLSFRWSRTQLPVAVCFAMTINKAQGQSFQWLGVDLRQGTVTKVRTYVTCLIAPFTDRLRS